jgi:predicted amidohydrolase YtcJ
MAGTTADLVMINGVIHTMDQKSSIASSLAVKGDRILAAGKYERVEPHIGEDTRVMDLAGNTLLPGFIESHGHFMWIGELRTQINLLGVDSIEDLEDANTGSARQPRGLASPGWSLLLGESGRLGHCRDRCRHP